VPKHSPAAILAALRAEGIDCEPHELGLARYCADPVAYAKALKRCQPTTLRVLTMAGDVGLDLTSPPCSGDFLCECPKCSREKMRLVNRGGIGEGPAALRVKRRAA
jgi:hypothetical protein